MAAQDKTSPAPAADELSMTGSVDVGYRWISGVGGNFDVYRSVVNLAEGPKLLGATHLFDRCRRVSERRQRHPTDSPFGLRAGPSHVAVVGLEQGAL